MSYHVCVGIVSTYLCSFNLVVARRRVWIYHTAVCTRRCRISRPVREDISLRHMHTRPPDPPRVITRASEIIILLNDAISDGCARVCVYWDPIASMFEWNASLAITNNTHVDQVLSVSPNYYYCVLHPSPPLIGVTHKQRVLFLYWYNFVMILLFFLNSQIKQIGNLPW